MLSPGAGGAEHLHLHVRRVELDVHRLHLRQHRHSGGGGVDPSAGLGLRHPLDPVDPAFKLESGPGPLPFYCKGDLLDPTQFCFTQAVHLCFPAAALGVHGVHPVQGVGEQGRLLPAHAGPDLHNDILVVIGVLGQEQELKLSLQPLQLRVGLEQLLLSQLSHLRVGQQLLCLSQALPGGQIASIGFHHRAQFILLLIQTGHRGGVVIGLRGGQSCLDLAVFCLNGGKFLQHRNLQHWIFNGRPQAAKFLIPNS